MSPPVSVGDFFFQKIIVVMTSHEVYRPPGEKILGMDHDDYIMVYLAEEITREEHERLPEGLSMELWWVDLNGETDISFTSKGHLQQFYVQTDVEWIPTRFGPKARKSFEKYDDPDIWWEDHFNPESENRNVYGIVKNLAEPVETEYADIKEVNEITLPLIRETYGLKETDSEKEESTSIFLQ